MTIIAVLEYEAGSVTAASREVVSVARALETDVTTVALPADATPERCGAGLARLLMDRRPHGVVAPASDHATEALAHLAAYACLPFAANCVAISAGEENTWNVTRSRGGGVVLEDAHLTAPTRLATLTLGSAPPIAVDDIPAPLELPEPNGMVMRTRIVDHTSAGGGVSLATAPVVVSGGRGIGSAEGFGVLEELATLLGGAVGCSRVVTNNGWRPHSDQVGQTGSKVAPDVYIAAGISGATQHWAGCMGSRTIIAINTDPEAAMVSHADYAVIGDAVEVLQAIVDELRRRRGIGIEEKQHELSLK
jgi:electron transfer flavoprotein alpha subunit